MNVFLKNNNLYRSLEDTVPFKTDQHTKDTALRAIEIGKERCLGALLNSQYILQYQPQLAIDILSLSPVVILDPEIRLEETYLSYWLKLQFIDGDYIWLSIRVEVGTKNIVDTHLKIVVNGPHKIILYNSL